MPYRRRRSGGYYRRRPAKPTTWIRNQDDSPTRTAANQIWVADILAPLHTEDAVLRVGGQYDSAPSSTGRTVVRIIGTVALHWEASVTDNFEWSDGVWLGIMKGVWAHDASQTTYPVPTGPGLIDPHDPLTAANTTDWQYWHHHHVHEDITGSSEGVSGGDLGVGHVVQVIHFDVRAKRSLREMGETVQFCARPAGSDTQGIEKITVTTSTLLR